MNTQAIYHLSLVTHIIGLTLMAGTTVADSILFKQFWKQLFSDRAKGLAVQTAMARLPAMFGIGILLLILSGVGMMAITNGVFGEQVWFRIKFGFVLAIIINGLAVGRRLALKLRKILSEEQQGSNATAALLKLKANIRLFHLAQLTMFIVVFTLSVFKFN